MVKETNQLKTGETKQDRNLLWYNKAAEPKLELDEDQFDGQKLIHSIR